MRAKVLVALVSIVAWANSSGDGSNSVSMQRISDYLWEPSIQKAKDIAESAARANGLCALDVPLDPEQLLTLQGYIEVGDKNALLVGLEMLPCWDGGDREDTKRSFGMFGDLEPELFMEIIGKESAWQDTLSQSIAMLPLSTTDNLALKIHILERRKTRLIRAGGTVGEAVARAIDAIDRETASLRRVESNNVQ